MNPDVDLYLIDGCGRCNLYATPECKVNRWHDELVQLRLILQKCDVQEDYKWKQPCYTYNDKNILILSAFNDCASLGFLKGGLLKDEHNVLVKPGKNTVEGRQWKFTDVQTILKHEALIKEYVREAVQIELSGKKFDEELKHKSIEVPDELTVLLNQNKDLKRAFDALTPGRQRGYYIHFNQPKQSKTRLSRIEKCIPKIMEGKGYHDR